MLRLTAILTLTFCFLFITNLKSVTGQDNSTDWPQWLGPNRNGHWNAKGILSKFPENGPKVLWRTKTGSGFAGPAVANGRVYLADFLTDEKDAPYSAGIKNKRTGRERLLCLDAKTGKKIWEKVYDCQYNFSYANGPRCTPTVDGDRVYFQGAEGRLLCAQTSDGKILWEKELKKEYNIPLAPHWGYASHPLVEGNHLYCVVGGKDSLAVCFDKMTGKEIWRSLDSPKIGYCPPTMITAGGTKQLLIWHPKSLNSLNPKTGKVYWSFKMKPAYDMSVIAPIKHGDYLYATALQKTSILLKLDKTKPLATEVWRNKGIHPDHNPPLLLDNHIYGVDEKGQLRCFDLITGKKKWESMATTHAGRPVGATTGFVVKNNDQFLLANEVGDLIIGKMNENGFEELDRGKMLQPTTKTRGRKVVWSHPAFAGKCVYARNDEEIVCISLAKEQK